MPMMATCASWTLIFSSSVIICGLPGGGGAAPINGCGGLGILCTWYLFGQLAVQDLARAVAEQPLDRRVAEPFADPRDPGARHLQIARAVAVGRGGVGDPLLDEQAGRLALPGTVRSLECAQVPDQPRLPAPPLE